MLQTPEKLSLAEVAHFYEKNTFWLQRDFFFVNFCINASKYQKSLV